MKDAGHRQAVEAALSFEKGERTPVNNFAVVTAARYAGKTVDEARWDPRISAEVAVDYAIRTESDFVKPVLDSQVPLQDLGMKVKFPEDDYGSVPGHIVETAEDVDKLHIFDPDNASECPGFTKIREALSITASILPEDLHICGLSWGPITTAGYLMGAENMMFATLVDPDIVKKLVAKSAELVSSMETSMIESGATVMWMADPTSSEDLISPDMFDEYSKAAIKKVIDDVNAMSDVPTFVHICGNTLDTIPRLFETGADCLSFDHAVDPAKARVAAGKKLALMGNVDPVRVIMSGTPEEVRAHSYSIIDGAGQEGGLILAPGCETPISSPFENVLAMGEAGRTYWQTKSL